MALTIAGSDCSAGAGAQADLKIFATRGVYGLTAITCIVAEIPGKVSSMQAATPAIVSEQIALLTKNFPVRAIKTGLLCNGEIVAAVACSLRKLKHKRLVVDPVMVASSGDTLLTDDAIGIYERELFPLATLITPNLDEAARLLGEPISDLPAMQRAVKALARKYRVAVLLKGGHLRGARAIDLFFHRGTTRAFSSKFIPGISTHGTGCTYSAAITAELAKGKDLLAAIGTAKRIVTVAIRNHFAWKNEGGKVVALNQSSFSPARV